MNTLPEKFMLNDIQETTLSHVTDLKTLSGTVKSYHKPFNLERKIMYNEIMSRPLRGYVDCEDCVQALADYISKATGKTVRITVEMRYLLVHMYSLRHQYRDGGLVSMSSVFAGYKHKTAMDNLRKLLEESGLIKMETGDWAYNPADRQRNRAPKYKFTPEFTSLLGLIHTSYAEGKESGHFALNKKPIRDVSICVINGQLTGDATIKHNDGTLTHDDTIRDNRDNREDGSGDRAICPIILVKAGATQKNQTELVENQQVTSVRKLMPKTERKQRDKKLENLWKGMSLSAMKKAGLDQKCRLQCVPLGMGAEVDDFAFISIMAERYCEDPYSKIVRRCDTRLPEQVKNPLTGKISTTHTSWSFRPQRDKHLNITKAGVRPCSDLCSTRNDIEDNIVLKPSETSRKAIMNTLHLPYHFDVHCSIHNLGRALKTGKFENTDIYSRVASRMNASRNDVKLAFMHACFGPLAEYCAKHPESKKANQHIHHKDKETKEDKTFPFTYRQIQDAMKAEQVPINGRYTEIFWDEAFIYDLVRLYLLQEQNIASARIYDSFYTRHEISETEFILLINRAIGDYQNIRAHNDAALSIRL